jgi:hypothetical protein
MTLKKTLVLLTVLMLAAAGAFAQATDSHTVTITVASIGMIGLSSNTDIAFSTVAPVLPGDPVSPLPASPATNSSKNLFYTTANLAGKTRHITVGSDVSAPAGTTLTVNAAMAGGAGTNAGPVTIGTSALDLVTGIGSVATGRTVGTSGATLTYSFWVNNPAALVVSASPTVVTVTYTLTADTF